MISKLLNLWRNSEAHFENQEPGEKVILLLRRHRFAVFYPLGIIILLALVPIVVYTVLPAKQILFYFISSLYYLWLWLILFYKLTIYSLNTLVITDRRIIENEQNGFFARKISELHVHRVQDVSVNIHGIIPTFFNFGDIVVQTAASEREFSFYMIAQPEKVKDTIMQVVNNYRTQAKLD